MPSDNPYYDAALEPVVRGGKRVAGHVEANGEETVDYVFTIPEGFSPERATFRAVVANDYRISVRQRHDFFRELTGRFEERETPLFTLIRSEDGMEAGEVVDTQRMMLLR